MDGVSADLFAILCVISATTFDLDTLQLVEKLCQGADAFCFRGGRVLIPAFDNPVITWKTKGNYSF
jgi:hypothetical protein